MDEAATPAAPSTTAPSAAAGAVSPRAAAGLQQPSSGQRRPPLQSAAVAAANGHANAAGANGASKQDQPIRRKALYWELLSQEELGNPDRGAGGTGDTEGSGTSDHSATSRHVVGAQGDIFVFEGDGKRSMLRRFSSDVLTWREAQTLQWQDQDIAVHAAVLSPADPDIICLLHCSSGWNSDHRYEVYALNATTCELEPLSAGAGIAPKRRHGFSAAACERDRSIYFFCGLQVFPGDVTGSFVYCFGLDDCAWTEVEYDGHFPAPSAGMPYVGCRFGQSCVVYEDKAWLFGGCIVGENGVTPTNDVCTFDLVSHMWNQVEVSGELQPPRVSGHAALVCCGHMLAFTGEGASQDIWDFNLELTRWELLPPVMLGPRPSDGRVDSILLQGPQDQDKLIAYQRYQAEAPGSMESWKHELFGLDVREVQNALAMCGGSSASLQRNRQELDLLDDDTTADVAFGVEGRRVVAHRAVLQRFSPALARYADMAAASASGDSSAGSLATSTLNSPGSGRQVAPASLEFVKFDAFHLMLEHIYSRFTKPLVAADAEILLEPARHFELAALARRCQEAIDITDSNVARFMSLALTPGTGPPLDLISQKCIAYLTSHPEHFSLVTGPASRQTLPPGSPEVRPSELVPVARAAAAAHAAAHHAAQVGVACRHLVPSSADLAPVVDTELGEARQSSYVHRRTSLRNGDRPYPAALSVPPPRPPNGRMNLQPSMQQVAQRLDTGSSSQQRADPRFQVMVMQQQQMQQQMQQQQQQQHHQQHHQAQAHQQPQQPVASTAVGQAYASSLASAWPPPSFSTAAAAQQQAQQQSQQQQQQQQQQQSQQQQRSTAAWQAAATTTAATMQAAHQRLPYSITYTTRAAH